MREIILIVAKMKNVAAGIKLKSKFRNKSGICFWKMDWFCCYWHPPRLSQWTFIIKLTQTILSPDDYITLVIPISYWSKNIPKTKWNEVDHFIFINLPKKKSIDYSRICLFVGKQQLSVYQGIWDIIITTKQQHLLINLNNKSLCLIIMTMMMMMMMNNLQLQHVNRYIHL